MSDGDPSWYAEVSPWQLRLWVCTPCLDDQCLWCQAMSCRCACNDASAAEMALADRIWRLANGVGRVPVRPSPASVAEIQEARRAALEAEMRDAYGHLGATVRGRRAAA